MWLIKDIRTNKFYKTKFDISDDRLRSLHSFPFIKSGVLTEDECWSDRLCLDRFNFIKIVMRFDGRVRDWKYDCPYFTWRIVIEEE